MVEYGCKIEEKVKAMQSEIKKNIQGTALAGVAQWIDCWHANQRVAGLIPSQGTCLGFRLGPQLGVHKRQPHTDVSLPLFLSPFPSLKINK